MYIQFVYFNPLLGMMMCMFHSVAIKVPVRSKELESDLLS